MSPTPASQLPGSGPNNPFLDQDAQYRILLIDDHSIVQVALQQILRSQAVESPGGTYPAQGGRSTSRPKYLVDACFTGEEGLTLLRTALDESLPYSVAFVDLHLSDDWDGLYTIQQLWALAPDLQVILCSAMKDSTWKTVVDELGYTDRLLILKKPFDRAEVLQLACALTRKWAMTRHIQFQTDFLQELVAARTEQLTRLNAQLQRTNQELEQARDAAVRACLVKSEFLGSVSHELRTPLTAILGFSELLLDSPADQSEHADFLQTIHRNAGQLLGMVDDLLGLSRIETERLDAEVAESCPAEPGDTPAPLPDEA